ncbi:S8 family serine peptidase [Sneathiella glossodoripedis]|uniref:S8 family serine peptidase n=1 Tax=Sneathiella glossodoripedis TaxID=418853 RepID=UPI00047110BC|nr:S8 family serine peptidase [Sneathiella glossodoripedis]
MKRVLISLCFVFSLAGLAVAQTGTSQPDPVTRSNDFQVVDPDREPKRRIPATGPASTLPGAAPHRLSTDNEPAFLASSPGCIRPNEILLVSGERLSVLQIENAYLQQGSLSIPLKLLNRSDRQLAFRLPAAIPDENSEYSLSLHDKRRGNILSGLKVSACPVITVAQVESGQELLVFGALEVQDPVRAELENLGVVIGQSYSLVGLGQFMFVIRSQELTSLRDQLKDKFPDVLIDQNLDLEASAAKPRLYAARMIGWENSQRCGDTNASLKIGLLDGEIEISHPAFKGGGIVTHDFIVGREKDNSHATAIASALIGHAPELGIQGLLQNIILHNAIVLRQRQDGVAKASVEAIVLGMDWMITSGVRVVGISLATLQENRVLEKVVSIANSKSLLIFAAAGNFGPEARPSYPAALPDVFAITAVDAAFRLFSGANTGRYIDFAAPGVDVWLAMADGKAGYQTGTSFAVPYAMAVAANYLKRNTALSRQVLEKVLQQGSRTLSANSELFQLRLIQVAC